MESKGSWQGKSKPNSVQEVADVCVYLIDIADGDGDRNDDGDVHNDH